ncbi:hypothetical protein EDC01DRAFT_636506 [Geopyxis carbonaria]|nr:hypothetical protein EDC01DRAFT_636506 [Geopyxis carbonaria]
MEELSDERRHKKLPTSPTFAFENSFTSASAYRPRVWTGGDDPGAGLLGFQAPAADGLDETFSISPASAPESPLLSIFLAPEETLRPKTKPLPRLPPEIHIQILTTLVSSYQSNENSCSFCRMFELSSLSTVCPLYYSVIQPLIYSNLDLTCTTSCEEHHRLSSKHQQLTLRLPLLLRTLKSDTLLAASVKSIMLPSSGMGSYLTCALEKIHLPDLIDTVPNLEAVHGVEDLLQRQFFSGEHYCLDGVDPQQHGILALALHRKRSLKTWRWNSGNAAGSDFWRRLWDFNPAMENINFTSLHSNWSSLETFVLHDVWGLSNDSLSNLFAALPHLRSVDLSGIRKKRVGHGDRALMVCALSALPPSVDDLSVGDVEDPGFAADVADWARARHANPLRRLAVGKVPITTEILQRFLSALSSPVSHDTRPPRYWLPLLDPAPQWCSCVRKLELDNRGFEEHFWPIDTNEDLETVGCMELRGLEELKWGVRCAPDGICGVNFLGARAVLGWFRDLRRLVLDGQDEEVETAMSRRGIELVVEG